MEGSTTQRPAGGLIEDRLVPALKAPGFAGWLLALVFACVTYAAFASGATTVGDESRVQVALAVGILAAGLGLAAGVLGAARSAAAWTGVWVLALFAIFSALSVQWSEAPGLSWIATNRAVEYAALTAIVLVAAPSVRRAPELAVGALGALAVAVALYALGGKLFPTLSIGPIDLDHASQFARLRAPLGYWNALGLLLVMAMPGCIWAAADRTREDRLRIASLLALALLVVTGALTLSRGAVLAFAVVVAVMVAAGPDRLRRLGVVAVAMLAAAPAVAFAFSQDQLTRDGVPAADRAGDGVLLAFILAVSMLALAGFALYVLDAELWSSWGPDRERLAWSGLAGLAASLAIVGVVALALSDRGLTGSVSHQWEQFKQPVGISNQPGRLVSSSSSNRWIWWSEAAGAFSDRPIAGWGAGSFPVLHDRYRDHPSQVRSTHDVPLQFLSEGGLIGAGLGLGGLALLGFAGVQTLRRSEGTDRHARLALLAAGAAWAVHSLYDWDWEIAAVTMPALAAVAIAATPSGDAPAWLEPPGSAWGRREKPAPALAVLLATTAAVLAVVVAVSAALPAIAEDKRIDALSKAAEASDDASLEDAASEALLAHKLNPLDLEALFAAANLQQRLGNSDKAEELVLQAVRLAPADYRVWDQLIALEMTRGNPELLRVAVRRRIEAEPLSFALDPASGAGILFAAQAPPQLSPTAFRTPPETAPGVPQP